MKIPLYFFKGWEELARGLTVTVGTYIIMTVTANGFPSTSQAVTSLLAGVVPIAIGAIRTWLNATPLTPPNTASGK